MYALAANGSPAIDLIARSPRTRRVYPRRLHQQRALGHLGHRALQVQAAVERYRLDRVAERRQQRRQLVDAVTATALRQPDPQPPAHSQHVSPVQRRRRFDVRQRSVSRQRRRHRRSLAASRLGARPGDHRQLIDHHRRILDEHRVGQARLRRQPLDGAAELAEQRLVGGMLALGEPDVDRLTGQVGELALGERRAHLACDCHEVELALGHAPHSRSSRP